nr:sigma 54-interacting transcriptional regulator [Desulfobulbaceae bacterium]
MTRNQDIWRDSIVESIADGVFTIDKDFTITFFNQAAEKITGIAKEKAVGQKCFDVLRANICQTACILKETMLSGKEKTNQEINILTRKGVSIPVSVSASVVRNKQGEIIGGVETIRDLSEIEILRKEVLSKYTFDDIVSKNHIIQDILAVLPDIATSGNPVLIEGPSGTGKELFAKAIHNLSNRKGKFIGVNCAALPDSLLESEFFGYKKGAFTEAKKDKPGRFALAEGGTMLLDEIGDISAALQAKLLRVLEEKEYDPLGATSSIRSDVRIIATTNKSLVELKSSGLFREDLFFRLNVVRIYLPPLSERREDIPLLINHFIKKFNAIKGKNINRLSRKALELMIRYDFPGNVRELANFIEYAFMLCHNRVIDSIHLPNELRYVKSDSHKNDLTQGFSAPELEEKEIILQALQNNNGSRIQTSAFLGIDKSTLWRKMQRLGIEYPTHILPRRT